MEHVVVPPSQDPDLRVETSRFMVVVPAGVDTRAIGDLLFGGTDADLELRATVLRDQDDPRSAPWRALAISKLGRPDQVLGVQYFRDPGGGAPLQVLTAFRSVASSAVARRHASAAALQLAFDALDVEVVATRVAIDNEAARGTAWAHGFEEVGKATVVVDGNRYEFVDLELTSSRYFAARPPTSVEVYNPQVARSVLGREASRNAERPFGR